MSLVNLCKDDNRGLMLISGRDQGQFGTQSEFDPAGHKIRRTFVKKLNLLRGVIVAVRSIHHILG